MNVDVIDLANFDVGLLPFSLHHGEEALHAADVVYLCPFSETKPRGRAYVTTLRLYFKPQAENQDMCKVDTMLGNISRLEKMGGQSTRGEHAYGLELFMKDMRTLRFAFDSKGSARRVMYEVITDWAFPETSGKKLFALRAGPNPVLKAYPGWDVYDPIEEYKRMGVPNSKWRISQANADYAICDSYGKVLAVPAAFTDVELAAHAEFRSRGRCVGLSYIHPATTATITRCSQPKVGVNQHRCAEDEKLLKDLANTNTSQTAGASKMYILDARPKLNARVNQAKGNGYENTVNYPNTELRFLNIENIHVMRDSLKKLKDVCYPKIDESKWLSDIEGTNWLGHISLVLSGAMQCVHLIDKQGSSVLVHCSDGWDRTAQISCLAMICLDPFFRTIHGLQVLITKEWLSFGHKFALRLGHGNKNHDVSQTSPVFLQFIDCVWQVMQQYPAAFEYGEDLLHEILENMYSCEYGTFLCNNEREREALDLRHNSTSLWSFINAQKEKYINPLHMESDGATVLYPMASIRKLRLWKRLYAKWNPTTQPTESMTEHNKELLRLNSRLKSEIAELEQRIAAAGAAA